MAMDGGMRLATGVCGQRPSCAVSVTLCAAPPAFRMLCCQAVRDNATDHQPCFKFMDAIHRRMFLLQPSSTFATAFGAPSLRQPSLGSTLTPSQLEQQPPSEIAPSGNAATASSGGTR
ncbi:hypothetical protein BDP67DRAFT_152389 [Colletotrichum lupini]|nr:hypothetical protein BDP67DRAFT_152389 [Colletotrichum lupini]